MANIIKLSYDNWTHIKNKITHDPCFMPSWFLIRSTMRRELGFTIRTNSTQYFHDTVYLDFYDDGMETMFRLKYL